jgi:tetratricopeptide (TPR) repeat protein
MKKINKILVFVFITMINHSFSQTGSYYGDPLDAAKFCSVQLEMVNSFATNKDAQLAVDKIINVLGISQRFAIYQCNGIDNCTAVTIRGVRYIFFDSYFMKDISNNTNSSWTNLSILAHEIGHHINGHTVDFLAYMTGQIKPINLAEERQQEIEADEFSGYVMFKLGATLDQAQQAISFLSFDGDDTYSSHPNKAKRLAAIKKGYDKAQNPSNSVLTSNNSYAHQAEYYFYLAMNNQFSSYPNYEYILENYSKAIQLNPNFANAYNNRGIVKKNQNLYNSAISDFEKAINIDQKNPAPYVNMGSVYFMLKDNKKALELVNKAISIDPNYGIAYNNRGGIKGAMGDHYGAISDFNISISINPNHSQTYLSRGLSKGALKDFKGAISDHDIVIRLEPQNTFAYKMRGLEKLMIGLYYCGDFKTACELGDCSMFNQYCR